LKSKTAPCAQVGHEGDGKPIYRLSVEQHSDTAILLFALLETYATRRFTNSLLNINFDLFTTENVQSVYNIIIS
jgi:hypothetical protein